MIDVHLPTTDRRELLLTRYTQPEPELQLLIQQLKLQLPPQPPPRIATERLPSHPFRLVKTFPDNPLINNGRSFESYSNPRRRVSAAAIVTVTLASAYCPINSSPSAVLFV